MNELDEQLPVTAFLPINHTQVVGGPEFVNHQFTDGTLLCHGMPSEVRSALRDLKRHNIAYGAANCIDVGAPSLAKGFLYRTADIPFRSDTHSIREHIDRDLITPLNTLRTCIHLAGGGENAHWYFGSHKNRSRIHVSGITPIISCPFEVRMLRHCGANTRNNSWTADTLKMADSLHRWLRDYQGTSIPRLALAFQAYLTLASLDPETLIERNLRLQIAVTALETLFIAPCETAQIWDNRIVDRIVKVCERLPKDASSVMRSIRVARNDTAHRAGLSKHGIQSDQIQDATESTEMLLRDALCWAIKNQRILADAFERDEWPTAI